jgi:peptidoglycan-associated lipoprotein
MSAFLPASATLALVAVIGLGGCATKGYVNDEIKNIEERVGRVETATGDASTQARNARELAVRGDEKAQQALLQAELARDMALGHVAREEVRREAIYFGFDSADLDEQSTDTVARIADEVRANPNYIVLLTGYADPSGDETYNIQLAERRAAVVRRKLAQVLGSDFVRIASIGLGELEPDVEGRSSNRESRRVDAAIVKPVAPDQSPEARKAGNTTD